MTFGMTDLSKWSSSVGSAKLRLSTSSSWGHEHDENELGTAHLIKIEDTAMIVLLHELVLPLLSLVCDNL